MGCTDHGTDDPWEVQIIGCDETDVLTRTALSHLPMIHDLAAIHAQKVILIRANTKVNFQ